MKTLKILTKKQLKALHDSAWIAGVDLEDLPQDDEEDDDSSSSSDSDNWSSDNDSSEDKKSTGSTSSQSDENTSDDDGNNNEGPIQPEMVSEGEESESEDDKPPPLILCRSAWRRRAPRRPEPTTKGKSYLQTHRKPKNAKKKAKAHSALQANNNYYTPMSIGDTTTMEYTAEEAQVLATTMLQIRERLVTSKEQHGTQHVVTYSLAKGIK